MEDKKPTKVDYEVVEARHIDGQWREEGETIQMTERQAQYYMPPHGTGLRVKGAGTADEKPARKAKS
ncbi:hypothetical protein RA27_02290 [Ruegeria sp. ANG-R]|uniref:hypothetical protein n=1 Tax=Ruegeria sp. ANG-R TaxID=1577903 RepID=UPI00057E45F7|nr:hypothetical protein [Ruegeria sp. ANG-R]KIC42239.1 hypothetical protein RA27_02290 [Ruegeria sp. ANG-R]